MRPSRITGAALTAALTVAITAAPATAQSAHRKHPNRRGTCTVNTDAAPSTLASGETVVVFGRLHCVSGASVADQPVSLFTRAAGAGSFTEVQTTSTDTLGYYTFTFADVTSSARFFVRSHGAASGVRAVRVQAHVTLSGPPDGSQLLTGKAARVTFTGTVTPADVGARVILQRQNSTLGNRWHRIGIGVVQAGGSYSIVHTFVVPSSPGHGGLGEAGDASIRTLVRSRGRDIPSPSNILEYEISQAENPQLTIRASADPITFGQPVTLSGAVTGAPKAPVTLLERTARQRGFAPIAQGTTDGAGNYTFAPQTPLVNTFYEVKSAGQVSAVLYEGVKDLLTAQLSATMVQAGQTLDFSGTVAPQHGGHVIYLERENAAATGFHVVEVATIQPGSQYSILHTVYDPGTKVFRVRIPGGPENEGAVSQAFTVQVTAAPASALTPEPSGNSSMPAEGQV